MIMQLTVFLENSEGRLAALCRTLADADVNMSALTIAETYRNMKEVIDRHPYLIENLTRAIRLAGLEPKSIAFRGGTDGSALSHRGLPCPNLSAGYENAHGRFEYVPIQSMEKNVEILLHLCALFGKTR